MRRTRHKALINQKQGIQLDIGCGKAKQPGWVGLDNRPLPSVDIVHDLTVTPWPLPDDCVLLAKMSHVWEHLPPWTTLAVMAEIHRVCKSDAVVLLSGPYELGLRYMQDPTHVGAVTAKTWTYFDPLCAGSLWGIYEPPPMHVERFEIVPAGDGDRDYEVMFRICKGKCTHGRT